MTDRPPAARTDAGCIEPPLKKEEEAADEWYCRKCRPVEPVQADPADAGGPDAPEAPAGAGYCWEAYRDGVRDGLERGMAMLSPKLGLSALLAETMEAQKGFPESREQNRATVRRGVLLDLIADAVRPAMAARGFEVETANAVGATSEPARMPWIRVFHKKLAPGVEGACWFLLVLFGKHDMVLTINRGVTERTALGRFLPSNPKQLEDCAKNARCRLQIGKDGRMRYNISDHLDDDAGSRATALAAANVVAYVYDERALRDLRDLPTPSAERFRADLDKLADYLAQLYHFVKRGHNFKVEA